MTIASMFFRGLVLILLLITSACAAPRDEQNLNTFQEHVTMQRLRVRGGDGAAIWEIQSTAHGVDVSVVHYGGVPAGFQQNIPSSGRPRPFKSGERLSILTVTSKTISCDRGTASGTSGFALETYRMIPTSGATPEWRRQAERIERCNP
jgi:hypothetical protein